VVQGGPRLGDLEAGGVADALGVEFSVVSGGLACILGAALLAAALPGFRRQRSREVGDPFVDDDLDPSGMATPEEAGTTTSVPLP
jgi:hypothetical protein